MWSYNKVLRNLRGRVPRTMQGCMCTTNPTDNPKAIVTKTPQKLARETDMKAKVELTNMTEKKDLLWRTPWHEKEGKQLTFLRSMYSEESNVSLLKALQTPINLSPSSIMKWWLKRREQKEIWMQHYNPDRNETLGNELAAAHFVVYRGGAVKFHGEDKWIKADDSGNYALPTNFVKDKVLQAIDCANMDLHYEGLENFRNLRKVEWLSVNNCLPIDDWCIDRIGHIFSDSLLYLDIRDCPRITDRGVGSLYKMNKLKILYVDDIYFSNTFEMTCLMLQDVNPSLDIRVE